MWGREWVIATYKHPALPSWVLAATRALTGTVGWPAYLVSQLSRRCHIRFVYRLGCDLDGSAARGGGDAAAYRHRLLFLAYVSSFNHNVVQTMFWAGFAWALWRPGSADPFGGRLCSVPSAAGGVYAKLSTGASVPGRAAWTMIGHACAPLAAPPALDRARYRCGGGDAARAVAGRNRLLHAAICGRPHPLSKPEGVHVFVSRCVRPCCQSWRSAD